VIFRNPIFLILLLALLIPLLKRKSCLTSSLPSFSILPSSRFSAIINTCLIFAKICALGLIILCLASPIIILPEREHTILVHDVACVFDLSGSMNETLKEERKIITARKTLNAIIEHLKDTRLSLVVFGDRATLISPPTRNNAIISSLIDIQSADMGGTNIEYGLLKALSLFEERDEKSHTRSILVISDGEADIPHLEYITQSFIKLGVNMYWINIDDSPLPYAKNSVRTLINMLPKEQSLLIEICNSSFIAKDLGEKINRKPKATITYHEKQRPQEISIWCLYGGIGAISLLLITRCMEFVTFLLIR